VENLRWRPERRRALAAAVGGEPWQSRAKRAAATTASPCPASAGSGDITPASGGGNKLINLPIW
jgi:hypothetical protein